MKYIFITIFYSIIFISLLKAQSGILDKSFGKNGKIVSETYRGYSKAITIQADDKIVVGGAGTYDSIGDFFLARYNIDGTLDNTFGNKGRVVTSFPEYEEGFRAVAMQEDGKIIGAGFIAQAASLEVDVAVIRYKTDGGVDSTFGKDGIVITDIAKSDFINDMVIQPDGKILVTGNKRNNDNDIETSFTVRYLPDGGLDENFGNKGIVLTVYDTPSEIDAIALQPDGKIIIGGVYDFLGSYPQLLTVRYLPNGTLDQTFGSKGLGKLSFKKDPTSIAVYVHDIAIDATGRITVIGEGDFVGSGFVAMMLARFLNDGKTDFDFGYNGYTTPLNTSNISIGKSVLIQPDRKILGAGGYNDLDQQKKFFALTRLNENGNIDSSFGENGITLTSFDSASSVSCNAAALQPDNKVVLLGDAIQGYPPLSYYALARYNNEVKDTKPIIARIKKWLHRHGFSWDDWPGNNINYYSVQRSSNGSAFNEMVRLFNRNNQQQFSYEDAAPLAGNNYYRLAVVSADGSTAYSNVIAIENTAGVVKIYPNPVKNNLQIEGLPATQKTKLTISDFSGNTRMSAIATGSTYNWNVAQLKQGNYILKIESNSGVVTKKFVKE